MNEREMINEIGGQDTAEIAIEAWRDAEENGFINKANPYKYGTYAALEYTAACTRHWSNEMKTINKAENTNAA